MPDELQEKAVRSDPEAGVEEKARELTPELRRQAEDSEAREAGGDGLDAADAAPDRASDGVAEHEQEMLRRGFEKAGPPGS